MPFLFNSRLLKAFLFFNNIKLTYSYFYLMADYSIEYKPNDNFLHVIAKGEVVGIKSMMTYSGIAITKVLEEGYKKALIDEREIIIKLSDHDQHELMNFFLNEFPKSLDVKFSTIYSTNNKDAVRFFEDLSNRVGFDCKFFETEEEALKNLED